VEDCPSRAVEPLGENYWTALPVNIVENYEITVINQSRVFFSKGVSV
jgi:hypothetical protein